MKYLFVACSLLLLNSAYCQINSMSNERVFGGIDKDIFSNFIAIPNSSDAFLVASSLSNISGDKTDNSRGNYDIWLLKLDENHDIVWQKTIGGEGFDSVADALIIDSLLYITCASNSPISGEKTVINPAGQNVISNWVICTDFSGNIIWQKSIGLNMSSGDAKFLQLKNQNLLLAFSSSTTLGNSSFASSNIVLYEINPITGDIVLFSTFGSSLIDTFGDIIQMQSGEIYVLTMSQTGTSINNDKTEIGFGSYDYWVLKLTENYIKISDKCYGGDQSEANYRMCLKSKNNFLYLVGTSSSDVSGNKMSSSLGLNDCWIVKIDLDLNYVWDRSYGGSADDFSSFNFANATDDLLISAYSSSSVSGNKTSTNFGSKDCWVFNIDEDGEVIDESNIGGSLDDYGQVFMTLNSSNQNIFAGTSLSPISGIKTLGNKGLEDIWLFNFNADELLEINEKTIFGNINIYPNPFQDKVTFSFPEINEDLHLKIVNLEGKTVYETVINNNTLVKEVEFSAESAAYFYQISGNNVSLNGKLFKVK